MADNLQGKKIAFLATDGYEESELEQPWTEIKQAGATVELISIHSGKIQGFRHFEKGQSRMVDRVVTEASPDDYDGLVLPGGVANPDALRLNREAVEFVRKIFSQKKPVAAICHGPWMLVEAGIIKGRTLTSWPSLKTDIENAGGNWVDEEVHCDLGLVTSRKPADLPAFCRKAIEEFREGIHERRAA